MKLFCVAMMMTACFSTVQLCAQSTTNYSGNNTHLFIDVHHFGAGKVTAEAVAAAHRKDLAMQGKYKVSFLQYWVDEAQGNVYCLSSASDTQAIRDTHAAAHGLLPDNIYPVTNGKEAYIQRGRQFFLDVHEMGAGNVAAKDLPAAQAKNLSIQELYDVNCINYWVDEKQGLLFCLSQAKEAEDVVKTHRAGHGLAPTYIMKVRRGK
jgi:hypothetical protein